MQIWAHLHKTIGRPADVFFIILYCLYNTVTHTAVILLIVYFEFDTFPALILSIEQVQCSIYFDLSIGVCVLFAVGVILSWPKGFVIWQTRISFQLLVTLTAFHPHFHLLCIKDFFIDKIYSSVSFFCEGECLQGFVAMGWGGWNRQACNTKGSCVYLGLFYRSSCVVWGTNVSKDWLILSVLVLHIRSNSFVPRSLPQVRLPLYMCICCNVVVGYRISVLSEAFGICYRLVCS